MIMPQASRPQHCRILDSGALRIWLVDLPATGGQLRARLVERNFREELMGDMQPPAAHYRIESGDNSLYAACKGVS
jgi:hypothetical protein